MSTAPIAIDKKAASMADASAASTHDRSKAALPVTVIEPSRGWRAVNFREVLQYHELLYFLIWRDVKVQYKQTILGPLWAVLRPVVNLVIFSVIFGQLAGMPSDDLPYPIFVYAGMLPWSFFSSAVVSSTGSLLTHAQLISKVYFPRLLLPPASMGFAFVTFLISFVIYGGLMLWFDCLPGLSVVFLPGLILLTILTALSVGYLLAGLTVIYRDLRFVVTSMVGAWMYLSPVIYPVTLIPEQHRWILMLNPMTGIIDGFRSVLLNRPMEWQSLLFSIGFTVVAMIIGLLVFRRSERHMIDVA